eukprot:maker-scaffold_9-snap-gene-8.56-mRNA-1 protein AED:0.00 eAED:0.00 QI:56/1/1/1/1/1/2/90/546
MDLNEKLAEANKADERKDYETAAGLYRELLNEAPENVHGKLSLYLGVSCYNSGKLDEALNAFKRAVASGDETVIVNAHSGISKCYERQNKWDMAIPAMEKLREVDQKKEFFKWSLLAHAYNQSNQFEKALDAGAKGLEEQPDDFEKFHNERIFAFFKLNKPMESVEDVEAILSKKPANELRTEQVQLYAEVLLQMGHSFMTAGVFDKSREYFLRAHDLRQTSNAKFLLGVNCLRLGDQDKMAEKWLKDAIESSPKGEGELWKYHVALGTVYMRPDTLSYENAIKAFEDAISLSKEAKNPNVCFNAGFALMKLNQDDKAKEMLQFVYSTDPANWIASALLGTIMVNKAEYEDAIDVLTSAIEHSNGEADDSVYYNLAYAYMMLNRFKEAEEFFKKAAEKNPNNEAAKAAVLRMGDEVKRQAEEEAEKLRLDEEERQRVAEEKKRQEEIEEMKRVAKEKEAVAAAEKAAAEEKARVAEEEKQRKIKIQEAKERKRKRLEELRLNIGGPQNNRLRRPSLDLIPVGNTSNKGGDYVSWYNKNIVHAPDNV